MSQKKTVVRIEFSMDSRGHMSGHMLVNPFRQNIPRKRRVEMFWILKKEECAIPWKKEMMLNL